MNHSLKTPILLLTYRKYKSLKDILNEIAKYNPPTLYIYQDAEETLEDGKYVEEIINDFPFDFELQYTKHHTHMGLNLAVLNAINSVFEKEEKLIIIEDDIIPNQSFFKFCDTMLERYKNNVEIGVINGCNLNVCNNSEVIFTSNYSLPFWGWATWREKWNLFDLSNLNWNEVQEKSNKFKADKGFLRFFFKKMSLEKSPWDVQWSMILMYYNQKIILPGTNLITNNGFSENGTYTNYKKSLFNNLQNNIQQSKFEYLNIDGLEKKYQKQSSILLQEILKNRKTKNFTKFNIFLSKLLLR